MVLHRLLVLENNLLVRRALLAALERTPSVHVVGETGEAAEGVRLARMLQPDVILVEPKQFDALTLVPQLRRAAPGCKLLLYTSYPDIHEEQRLLAAGADAYLLKGLSLSPLDSWFPQDAVA